MTKHKNIRVWCIVRPVHTLYSVQCKIFKGFSTYIISLYTITSLTFLTLTSQTKLQTENIEIFILWDTGYIIYWQGCTALSTYCTSVGKVCLPEAIHCSSRTLKQGALQFQNKTYWFSWQSDERVLRYHNAIRDDINITETTFDIWTSELLTVYMIHKDPTVLHCRLFSFWYFALLK